MSINIHVWKKVDNEYIGSCPELEVFCYGQNENQARDRLLKVISFYAETATELGYKIDVSKFFTEEQKKKPTIHIQKENNWLAH